VVTENNGGFGGVITTNPGADNTGCGLLINSNRTYAAFPSVSANSTSTGASRAIVSIAVAAGVSQIFFNGSLQGNRNYSDNVVNATSTVLGRYRTEDGNFGAFDLEELVVVVGTSSSTIRQQLEGWMAHSLSLASGLPSDHPHKAAAPTA